MTRSRFAWEPEDIEFVGAVYQVTVRRGDIVAHYPATGGWPNPLPDGHTLTRFPDPAKLSAYRSSRAA